jgi:hypothetical protein
MSAAARAKTRFGLISAALLLMFLFVFFQLARHPETLALLTALPNPTVLVCNIRCQGLMPFLQVLGETGRGLILIVMSFFLLYASARTGLRIARTWNFLERIDRRAVHDKDVPRPSFLANATVFEDPRSLAFTGGLLRPRIFPSFKKIVLAIVLLAITAFIALAPLKKNLISMFIGHDQTCVLRTGHK